MRPNVNILAIKQDAMFGGNKHSTSSKTHHHLCKHGGGSIILVKSRENAAKIHWNPERTIFFSLQEKNCLGKNYFSSKTTIQSILQTLQWNGLKRTKWVFQSQSPDAILKLRMNLERAVHAQYLCNLIELEMNEATLQCADNWSILIHSDSMPFLHLKVHLPNINLKGVKNWENN